MKMIYLSNARIPTEKAHGVQIMKTCDSLARNGVELEMITPRRINKIKEDPFKYYGIKKTFKITYIPCIDANPFIPKYGHIIQTFIFLLISKIYLFFKKYDILYTREVMSGLFFKDFVFEYHSFLKEKIRFTHREIIRKAKCFVVKTKYIKERLVGLGVDGEKILINPNGVDLKEFDLEVTRNEARERLGLPSGKKIIVYTGSFYLYDWKGVSVLLEASRKFSDDYLFVLVGGNENEINELKGEYKNKNLKLIGHRPHAEIAYYLKSADVLALPNKKGYLMSEKHTSPIKMFEYMASKRTIVASRLPSIEIFLNKNNSVLVEANDPGELAKGIQKAIEDVEFSKKLSEEAYRNVLDYTWDSGVKRIIKLIKKYI